MTGIIYTAVIGVFITVILITAIAAGFYYLARRFNLMHLETVKEPVQRRHK